MKYLTPKEIKDKRDILKPLQQRASWDVRSGKILSLAQKYIPQKEALIIDCACADGSLMRQLGADGYSNLKGVDIDDYRSDGAKHFAFKAVDVCAEKLPWRDSSIDAVVSSQTIEHLENPHFFVREAARVLKPGGIFIVSTPNPFHLLNRFLFLFRGNLFHFLEDDNHLTFFTRAIFKKTFLKHFKLLQTDYAKVEFKYKFLNSLEFLKKLLPANQWFARYVYYILQKP